MDKQTRLKIARLERKIARLEKNAFFSLLEKILKKLINSINKGLEDRLGRLYKNNFKQPNLKRKVKFQGEKYTLAELVSYAKGAFNPKLKRELAEQQTFQTEVRSYLSQVHRISVNPKSYIHFKRKKVNRVVKDIKEEIDSPLEKLYAEGLSGIKIDGPPTPPRVHLSLPTRVKGKKGRELEAQGLVRFEGGLFKGDKKTGRYVINVMERGKRLIEETDWKEFGKLLLPSGGGAIYTFCLDFTPRSSSKAWRYKKDCPTSKDPSKLGREIVSEIYQAIVLETLPSKVKRLKKVDPENALRYFHPIKGR